MKTIKKYIADKKEKYRLQDEANIKADFSGARARRVPMAHASGSGVYEGGKSRSGRGYNQGVEQGTRMCRRI